MASTAILGCILVVLAILGWIVLGLASNSGVSYACGELTWPLFVGKWEDRALSEIGKQQSQERLHLLLYPGGEAVKGGQKGTWKIVTCKGPTILIDLPRRQQTDACELRVNPNSDPERITGTLSCAGTELQVRRTETRGLVSDGVVNLAQRRREENRRYEQEMARVKGWGRVWAWCRLKLFPWIQPDEPRRTPPLHLPADAAVRGRALLRLAEYSDTPVYERLVRRASAGGPTVTINCGSQIDD